MNANRLDRAGFTTLELLIVIIVVILFAAIAIPRFNDLSERGRLVALDANLIQLRKTIMAYRLEHERYPGSTKLDDCVPVTDADEAAAAFRQQLTLFTDRCGVVSRERDAVHFLGPYLKPGIPANPFNGSSEVTCNLTERDQDATVSTPEDGTGWKYYVKTGLLIPNH